MIKSTGGELPLHYTSTNTTPNHEWGLISNRGEIIQIFSLDLNDPFLRGTLSGVPLFFWPFFGSSLST